MTKYKIFGNTTQNLKLPSFDPLYNLDLINNPTIPPDYTFTRNSSGTYVGPDGLIKTAVTNQPRFDYDPTTGAFRGLLVEEARTNYSLYSEQFNDAYWSKQAASIAANSVIAPDGANTADKLIALSTGSSTHYVKRTFSGLPSSQYSVSVYAKAAEHSYLAINANVGVYTWITFNLANGSIVYTENSNAVGKIESVGNGWYRCLWSSINANTSLDFSFSTSATSGGFGSFSFTGDNVSGLYLWGAQLEAGSYSTSYIPTTGSTVTRQPDQLVLNKPLNSQGTFFVEATTTTGTALAADNDTNAFLINPTVNTTTKNGLYYNTNRTLTMSSTTSNPIQSNINTPPGLNRVSLGFDRLNNTSYINGYIKKFMYYDSPVTEDNLRSLTGNNTNISRGGIVTNGLVLHLDAADYFSYPGSGTIWRDLSGQGKNGTLVNGPTYSSANGGSIVFDGVDDVSSVSTLPTRDGVFTNEIIFYPTSLTGGASSWSTLMFFSTSTPRSFYFIFNSSGAIGTSHPNATYTADVNSFSSNGLISVNNWYHAVQVLDKPNNILRIYLNGSLVLNVSPGTHTVTTTSSVTFAQQDTDPSSPFARRLTGRISNAKIYNRALTATEITQNFNALRGRYGI